MHGSFFSLSELVIPLLVALAAGFLGGLYDNKLRPAFPQGLVGAVLANGGFIFVIGYIVYPGLGPFFLLVAFPLLSIFIVLPLWALLRYDPR